MFISNIYYIAADKRHFYSFKHNSMYQENYTLQRIAEIEHYITALIRVRANINKTQVKFELYDDSSEKISITFTDPFFEVEMKQKFMADFIDRAIDCYQREYQHLKSIIK